MADDDNDRSNDVGPQAPNEKDGDEGDSWLARLLGAVLSPEGITEVGHWREAWKDLEIKRLDLAEKSANKAHWRTTTFIALRWVLSMAVVGTIGFLGYTKTLESQALLALLGGVVGSLFVQPSPAVSAAPVPPRVGPHIGK